MKRTVFRVTAAALAVVTPLAITTVASPVAFAQPAAAEAPAVAPAEVQLNTATPHQDLEKTKWRTIVANYQKAGYAVEEVSTYSPSMNRLIPVVLIRPVDPAKRDNAPTLYLLNGADGGEGRANWLAQTDVIEYYGGNEGKRDDQKKARGQMTSPGIGANIVIPMAGAYSYYTDWEQNVPQLEGVDKEGNPAGQKQKWETYLTQELPQGLEPAIKANGNRALAGMSMTGTTSLLYAQHNPGFYSAIGSFSGCASTTNPITSSFINLTLGRGGANFGQMWGALNSPTALHNDALLNAEKLRGQSNIYVSNGSGIVGRHDLLNSPRVNGDVVGSAKVTVEGGAIEAATNLCTLDLAGRTNAAGIPVNYNFRPQGTHQWGYWQDDTRDFWATLVKGLNTGAQQPGPAQDLHHAANGGTGSAADIADFFPLSN